MRWKQTQERLLMTAIGPGPDQSSTANPSMMESPTGQGPDQAFDVRRIQIVADYGQSGDSAFAEVEQVLVNVFPNVVTIGRNSVPPFHTESNGYILGQLLFGGPAELGDGTLIFHNVAPRKDKPKEAREGNVGEEFWIGKQAGRNVFVAGPASGFSWSVLRDLAVDIRRVPVPQLGSQFRSRDYFPFLTAEVLNGDKPFESLARVPRHDIPVYPPGRIAFIDGYGNMKMSSGRLRGVNPGDVLDVTLEYPKYDKRTGLAIPGKTTSVTRRATVAGGSFEVAEGQLAYSSGSSGWEVNGERSSASELFLRGGSAAKHFKLPTSDTGFYLSVDVTVSARPLRQKRVLISEPLTAGQSETTTQRHSGQAPHAGPLHPEPSFAIARVEA